MAGPQGGRGGGGGVVGRNLSPRGRGVPAVLGIMMGSAAYSGAQSLKGGLAKTASAHAAGTSVAAVTVTKEGAFLFNGEPVSEADLAAKLAAASAGGAEVNLVVSADERALHGQVVHVIDLAKVAGIAKFAINVERSR